MILHSPYPNLLSIFFMIRPTRGLVMILCLVVNKTIENYVDYWNDEKCTQIILFMCEIKIQHDTHTKQKFVFRLRRTFISLSNSAAVHKIENK